jgi:hypothetical protein
LNFGILIPLWSLIGIPEVLNVPMNGTTQGEAHGSPNRRLDGKILQKKIFFNEYFRDVIDKTI